MAIEIIARIWRRPKDELDSSEKFVLTVMADRADDDGLLWYAVDTIADLTSLSDRGVQKIMDRLITKGMVKKLQRRDRSNYYVIQLDRFPHVERTRRPKEIGPKEFIAELDAEPDLFGTGEPGSGTGERRSLTGEPGSLTGEPGSPYSLNDSLSDSLNESPMSPDDRLVGVVVDSWNALAETFERLPSITMISDPRRSGILKRADEHAGRFEGTKEVRRLAVWKHALEVVSRSKLLTGQKTDWNASFDWVTKKANFLKVMEENYGRGDDAIGSRGKATDRSAVEAGSEALGLVERARQRRSADSSYP